MIPVLFTVGKFPVTPIGVSLFLSLICGLFIIWRIRNIYDLDPEKTLDVFFWSFVGGYITARLYYVLLHLDQFDSFVKVISILNYPGLSLYGGLIGGFLTMAILALRFKVNLWQILDYAIPPLILGVSLTSMGCLFSACQYGLPYNGWGSVPQAGLIDRRFPIQVIEAVVFFILFLYFYRKVLKFHFGGQIASLGLIFLGIFKFIFEMFRGDTLKIAGVPQGYIWGIFLIYLGVYVYYRRSKRILSSDLKSLLSIFASSQKRKLMLSKLTKSWYYLKVSWRPKIFRRMKGWTKGLNVRSNPSEFKDKN